MDSQGEFSRAEMMIVTMARLLRDADNVFMGVASNLPFFSIWLAKELYNKDLTWLNIPGRVNPRPSFPPRSTVDFQLYKNGSASITLSQIFDMSARGELDIAFLSGVQVDKHGNFNLSYQHSPKDKYPVSISQSLVSKRDGNGVFDNSYVVGESVSHHSFGRGVITNIEGNGDETKVVIFFPNHGTKKILARFQGLRKS